jgi:hypothetical protein
MEGKGIIIVGATRTGKTTFVKSLISKADKKALLIYDVNNEYKEFTYYPFVGFDEFTQTAKSLKNGVVVFEEATIFLNNRGTNRDIIEMLVRKRHTGMTYLFCFHSVRSIPKEIYELCNIIAIKKTTDNAEYCGNKLGDERITEIIKKIGIASKNNPYETFILNIY